MTKDRNMPPQRCPRCGYYMDTAECMLQREADPVPGDITICANCGDLLIWLFDMTLAVPKDEVQVYLDASPEDLRVIKMAQSFFKQRRRMR
jgi:hypothetical protein